MFLTKPNSGGGLLQRLPLFLLLVSIAYTTSCILQRDLTNIHVFAFYLSTNALVYAVFSVVRNCKRSAATTTNGGTGLVQKWVIVKRNTPAFILANLVVFTTFMHYFWF